MVFVRGQKFDDVLHCCPISIFRAVGLDTLDSPIQGSNGLAFELRHEVFPRSHDDTHVRVDVERAQMSLDIEVAEEVDVPQYRFEGDRIILVQFDRRTVVLDELAGRTAERFEVWGGGAQDYLVTFDPAAAEFDVDVGVGIFIEETASRQY